ncbi:MAG: 16S rRNA (cytosine(1402)-N(4))-methyltransferase RsmH [Patescibacteria group bacterium]|nr:MAG: 16S rRNA (cytosine(1402)-N(4))-methyltransferase RsmH [Patescibacteria group bacterium]
MPHIPVLLKEVLSGLEIRSGETVLDATLGGGGHSTAICEIIGSGGTLVGLDQDSGALAAAKERLEKGACTVQLAQENFRDLDKALDKFGIGEIDKALFDLGMGTHQLEGSGRGFSFQKDEPLIMTFDPHPTENDLTAREIVNNWDEENIADILYGYGGERFARRIAKGIAKARKEGPIERTSELVEIIKKSVPAFYRKGKTHPATKTFQALRITANDEIGSLKEGLGKALRRLKKGGRVAVISFHSIEDRIVKIFFKEEAKSGEYKIITKKPIAPSRGEIAENPRARSAKLRIIEHI